MGRQDAIPQGSPIGKVVEQVFHIHQFCHQFLQTGEIYVFKASYIAKNDI